MDKRSGRLVRNLIVCLVQINARDKANQHPLSVLSTFRGNVRD